MFLAWCQIVARSRMRANKLGIPKNLVFTAIPEFQGFWCPCLPSTKFMFFSLQNFPNGKKILTVSCFTSQSFSEFLEICGLSKILVGTSHRWFLEHWNGQKSLCNTWQRFSCLLDEWIEKICKKFFFHGGFFMKSTFSVLRCRWTGPINLKIFFGHHINYLIIWPFMCQPWFPTRKASKLKYGFCKKLLRYKWTSDQLNTFFLTFCPDQCWGSFVQK